MQNNLNCSIIFFTTALSLISDCKQQFSYCKQQKVIVAFLLVHPRDSNKVMTMLDRIALQELMFASWIQNKTYSLNSFSFAMLIANSLHFPKQAMIYVAYNESERNNLR